jgi:hypothetical protein
MLSEGKLEFGRRVVEIVRCGAIVAQESCMTQRRGIVGARSKRNYLTN